MKLSQYAKQHGVTYRTAWNRFNRGEIDGAYMDDTGHIVVPDPADVLKTKAAIYARVSTHKQKDDLVRQEVRLKAFAASRGFEIAESVCEVGSGVNDNRTKLIKLLYTPTWGTLIVEHRDRLTRVGFNWFATFLSLLGKELIVVDASEDSGEGRLDDIFALMYALAASEYGKRGAKYRAERACKALQDDA